LDLAIAAGSFVGLLGANGAGKSTLLRTLAGLLPPLAGNVWVAGKPIGHYDARGLARQRGYLGQEPPTDAGWRVGELVALGRFAHQRAWGLLGGAADRAFVARAIARAGVEDLVDRRLDQLSGGQRQRVHLARAFAQGAPLLFLDEPTAHLDVAHQLAFHELVREAVAGGLTVVAVLHDLNLASQFCDRLVLVRPGEAGEPGNILADGCPDVVIRPELVERAFGLRVQVRHHPETGRPYVLPAFAPSREPGRSARLRAARRERLHVVAGGGVGQTLLPAAWRMGYALSVGVVNLLDSDHALASRLGADVVAEAPFSPIGSEACAALGASLADAATVVVAEVAFGSGNVENLRAVLARMTSPFPPRVWLVGGRELGGRDFTGGEAQALWGRLLAAGAEALTAAVILRRLEEEAGG
jgi:iron complex transport system ATP-binding protein